MPTVCASEPVQAPTTTILRPSRVVDACSISSRESASVRTSGTSMVDGSIECCEWPYTTKYV